MRSRYLVLLGLIPFLAAPSFAQDTSFSAGPQYLITTDPMFLHSIATPSLSLGEGAPAAVIPFATQTVATEPVPTETALPPSTGTPSVTDFSRIYWGSPVAAPSSEIEITSAALPPNLPAGIFEPGVTGITNAQTLRQRGYGLSVAEAAAYSKANKRRASRVFTNEDLARLRR